MPMTLEERVSRLEGQVKLLEKVHPDMAAEMSKLDKLRNEMECLRKHLEAMVRAAEQRLTERMDYSRDMAKRDREGIEAFVAQCVTKPEFARFKEALWADIERHVRSLLGPKDDFWTL